MYSGAFTHQRVLLMEAMIGVKEYLFYMMIVAILQSSISQVVGRQVKLRVAFLYFLLLIH